jgi:hypothetical protein
MDTMSWTSPLPSETKCVGCYGAEISKLLLTNKSSSFKPEGFETSLFQTGCFAFRSLARMDFVLKFTSSVMSASLHALWRFINKCQQHFSMSNRYADPRCFYWKEGRQVSISMWDSLFDCNGSSALMSVLAIVPIYMVIWNVESHVVSDVSLRKVPHLFLDLAFVFVARGLVSQCRIGNSFSPNCCEERFTASLLGSGYDTDTQKTSYVIATSLAAWRDDCCLATSNNIRNFIVACVYSVARSVA